jgi:D-glycero-D-manno-heptose 1,7-bisphosphate phosphatase
MNEAPAQPGAYAMRLTDLCFEGRPALFLDRDGVLVEEVHYLHRFEDVAVIDGVPEAIARANVAGIPVIMVTNQAGIGRGYYDWRQFAQVQERIVERCRAFAAHYDMVLACAYHAEGVGDYGVADHPWRKPLPGMFLEAARVLRVDLQRSFVVGDTLSDLIAGAAAGLKSGALVLTGHGSREWSEKGHETFERLRAQSAFDAQVMPDAATAIQSWLKIRMQPLEHVS